MIVKPPTQLVLECCDALDRGIGWILRAASCVGEEFGYYEAPVEAKFLLNLLIRHTEGILTLAKEDLVLLPAALVLARAAFETSTKIRWMLWPHSSFEREARWLVHLEEEERLWERIARISTETRGNSTVFRDQAQYIHDFRKGVDEKLPKEVIRPKGNPTIESALKEQDLRRYYVSYALLSQFTHSNHLAGAVYRRGLGTSKQGGEFINSSNWALPMQVAWWSLYYGADVYVRIACEPGTEIANQVDLDHINGLLNQLSPDATSNLDPVPFN